METMMMRDVGGGGGKKNKMMNEQSNNTRCGGGGGGGFQMPVHYPRYTRSEYETMPEWKLDCLLKQYGLPVSGDVNHKRNFAMGAFLWSY